MLCSWRRRSECREGLWQIRLAQLGAIILLQGGFFPLRNEPKPRKETRPKCTRTNLSRWEGIFCLCGCAADEGCCSIWRIKLCQKILWVIKNFFALIGLAISLFRSNFFLHFLWNLQCFWHFFQVAFFSSKTTAQNILPWMPDWMTSKMKRNLYP